MQNRRAPHKVAHEPFLKHETIREYGEGELVYQSGDISVTTMTYDDAEFVARIFVDSFEDKFRFAISSRERIEKFTQIYIKQWQSETKRAEYPNNFIARIKGERCGLLTLKYHMDDDSAAFDPRPFRPVLGGWYTNRLRCVMRVLSENNLEADECYIDHICVHKDFRNRGIGQALLRFAEIEAKRRGFMRLTLWVARANRAQRLYAREGFKEYLRENWHWFFYSYVMSGFARWSKMQKLLQPLTAKL